MDKAIDTIHKKCKQAMNMYRKGYGIYRGIDFYGSASPRFLEVDPKKGEPRKSANTYNYYTLLNDNSPKWLSYPKRNQSIICSTLEGGAQSYGTSYYVFPYDGSKIGVCPASDYWFSFQKVKELGIENMNEFNNRLYELFRQVDIKISETDYKRLTLGFSLFDLKFADDPESIKSLIYEDGHYILLYYLEYRDMLKYINDLLSPKPNRFKLNKIGSFNTSGNHEVWTDGKSILIADFEMTPKFFNELLK